MLQKEHFDFKGLQNMEYCRKLVSFNKYECDFLVFISECFTKESGKILSQETTEWSIIQYYGYKRNNFAIF